MADVKSDTFPALADDYSARNVVKFANGDVNDSVFGAGMRSPGHLVTTSIYSGSAPRFGGENAETVLTNGPPPLPHPTKLRKNLLIAGFVIAGLDLCVMPMVYFYALSYGTELSRQSVFIVITCLFCMMTFAHYTHRCLRLLLKCSTLYGPIGWQRKWRLLEFTNVNFAICATLFETVLVVGTSPTTPLVRVCALTSSIICIYFCLLFLGTAYLTQYSYILPFPMSSTPKGLPFRPALLAALEDTGSIEARCEVAFRSAVMRRYEASPVFRKMLLRLTWGWGWGLGLTAVMATVLIAVLENEDVAFGVGWGLPYVMAGGGVIASRIFIRTSLDEEKRTWRGGRGMELS